MAFALSLHDVDPIHSFQDLVVGFQIRLKDVLMGIYGFRRRKKNAGGSGFETCVPNHILHPTLF
jgi:hypothetical protein